MNKPILAISLALNIGLIAYVVTPRSPSDKFSTAATGTSRGASASPSANPTGSTEQTTVKPVWPPLDRAYFDSKPGARELAQRLHREGWPGYLIHAVVATYVSRGLDAEFAQIAAKKNARYWDNSQKTEQNGQRLKLADRQIAEVKAAMEGIPPDPWQVESETNRSRFGNLAPEKIARVDQISRDYGEQEKGETYKNKSPRERDLVMGTLAAERRADLMKVLTDGEYLDYMARSSEAAQNLKFDIQDLGIDEQQYLALFKDALAWREKYQHTTSDPAMRSEAEIARQKNRAAYEEVLGQEKFVQFLELREPIYRSLSGDMGRMNFSPADSLALWKIVYNANIQISQIQLDLDRGKGVDAGQANAVAIQAVETARQKFGSGAFTDYLATNPRWLTRLVTTASQVKKSP